MDLKNKTQQYAAYKKYFPNKDKHRLKEKDGKRYSVVLPKVMMRVLTDAHLWQLCQPSLL